MTVSTVAQLNASLATNLPGKTILLTNKVWQDADVPFKKNGTAANSITLRAQTPGQVFLSGNSRLRIAGNWLVVDGLRFQNIVRSSNSPLIDIRTTPTNFFCEGNFFSGTTVGITSAGISTSHPLLVLSSHGLWRSATNSPVLGAATGVYSAVTNDFDGQPRPAAKDAGCDQFSTNSTVRQPLGPPDVGPVWMRSVGPIRTVASVSNAVTLTWDSLPALNYQVQFSSNLITWATVSQTISNFQTSASWTDDGSQTGGAPAAQTKRFYRIRLLPWLSVARVVDVPGVNACQLTPVLSEAWESAGRQGLRP